MKKKQMVITFILIFAMAMTVTACGIEKDTDESATAGSVIDIEDIMQEIPTEDVKEETDNSETEVPAKSEDINIQSGKEINSGTDTNEQVNQQSAEPVVEPSEKQVNQQSVEPVVEPSEEQKPTEQSKEQSTETTETPMSSQQTQNVSVPSATIVGSIKALGNESFSISRANVNGNVMVSTDETVNVVYSDSTEFEVCTSTDGGITASFSAGTPADLQAGRMVNIEGAYEGSDFVAQKIRIEIFG